MEDYMNYEILTLNKGSKKKLEGMNKLALAKNLPESISQFPFEWDYIEIRVHKESIFDKGLFFSIDCINSILFTPQTKSEPEVSEKEVFDFYNVKKVEGMNYVITQYGSKSRGYDPIPHLAIINGIDQDVPYGTSYSLSHGIINNKKFYSLSSLAFYANAKVHLENE